MPTTIEKSIQFRASDADEATGATLYLLEFDQSELTKRALTRVGLCWLAALATAPFPGVHLITVPGFVIAGPILGRAAYKMKIVSDHADGECPTCRESISLKLEPSDTLPKWMYCPSCNKSIQVSEK